VPNKFPVVDLEVLFVVEAGMEWLAVQRPHADIGVHRANGHELVVVGEIHAGYAKKSSIPQAKY
jgi:hypothetical protein